MTKNPTDRKRYGTGGLNKLKAEPNGLPCVRGAVGDVLIPGNPNSAGSQFFIVISDQPQLTGKHTVFGRIVSGLRIAETISQTPADDQQLALERITIRRITLQPIPRPEFTNASVETLKQLHAILVTNLGEIEVSFFPEKAPTHVRQFLNFSKAGLYNGTNFHRIVPGFVIQGGLMRFREPALDERFSTWVTPMKGEFNDIPHLRGILSMARTSDPDSARDSFFICLEPAPRLDGQYTVFGTVTRGMEVVTAIASVPCNGEQPVQRVEIREIRVIQVPSEGPSVQPKKE